MTSWRRVLPRVVFLAVMPLLVIGCASTASQSGGAGSSEFSAVNGIRPINDPFESVNRIIFTVNKTIDAIFLEPIAVSYRELTPEPIRRNVTTLLRNMRLPLNAVHALLQGKFREAGLSTGRFLTNSVTLWVGDLMPQVPYPDEDAGQTLGVVTGTDGGPYLVLPLLGPSNVRDALGRLIDAVIDPVGFVVNGPAGVARTVVDGVDTRARVGDQLDELEAGSLDFYATIRSLYTQRRDSLIRDGRVLDQVQQSAPVIVLDFEDDFANDFGPAGPATGRKKPVIGVEFLNGRTPR